jgi:hypothetical protein
MARIGQGYLNLNWEVVEQASDLERLRLLLNSLDDEALMQELEKDRKQRRDDYPVRVCWNCLLAQHLLGHAKVSELLRELRRNPTLRRAVGMDPHKGEEAVPTKDAMSRFTTKLSGARYRRKVQELVDQLVEQVREYLPDLGQHGAVDSTALRTWARGRAKPEESSDPEADWGRKTRRWTDAEGKVHEEVRKWFGYKLHLVVDTRHEVPLTWKVTRASAADNPEVIGLLEGLRDRHPQIRVQTLAGDKAYDDGPLIETLHEEWGIRAVFDLRETSKDGEDGEVIPGSGNMVLGDDGQVYCYYKKGPEVVQQPLVYWGFEARRGCQKWRCPAAVHGGRCPERDRCGPSAYGRVVRVKCQKDWRRFGPMPHGTKQRKRRYNGRTACERVNSRLKTGLALDDLHVRGKARIELRVAASLIVLLGMAKGHLQRKAKAWRSLTRLAR